MASSMREYKEIYRDKKSIEQKEVEQMMRTREMSKEERNRSKALSKMKKRDRTSGRETPGK